MDIGFTHDSWLRRARPPREGGAAPGFDWQGLAARLSAAYALRRALATRDTLADTPSGSFDEDAAFALAAYAPPADQAWQAHPAGHEDGSRPVNPLGLELRKPASGKNGDIAGPNAFGDRGLK